MLRLSTICQNKTEKSIIHKYVCSKLYTTIKQKYLSRVMSPSCNKLFCIFVRVLSPSCNKLFYIFVRVMSPCYKLFYIFVRVMPPSCNKLFYIFVRVMPPSCNKLFYIFVRVMSPSCNYISYICQSYVPFLFLQNISQRLISTLLFLYLIKIIKDFQIFSVRMIQLCWLIDLRAIIGTLLS